MKAVILAGGYGTRLSEETTVRPKPLVEIGGQPVLWHIMKIYAAHGITDFVVACGYKGHLIKEYFAGSALRNADVTFDLARNEVEYHRSRVDPWRVTLVDTGEATMTGGRLARLRDHLDGETFCLTYGDGVSDVDVGKLVAFHRMHDALATLTAVQPPGRFGALVLETGAAHVTAFREKRDHDGERGWINGGFFVVEPAVLDYIESDATVWEREPLERLADEGRLAAFRHEGFWQPMDTLRDKMTLEELWARGDAPWKVW